MTIINTIVLLKVGQIGSNPGASGGILLKIVRLFLDVLNADWQNDERRVV